MIYSFVQGTEGTHHIVKSVYPVYAVKNLLTLQKTNNIRIYDDNIKKYIHILFNSKPMNPKHFGSQATILELSFNNIN